MRTPLKLALAIGVALSLAQFVNAAVALQVVLLGVAWVGLLTAAILEHGEERQRARDLGALSRAVGDLAARAGAPASNHAAAVPDLVTSVALVGEAIASAARDHARRADELVEALSRADSRLRDPLVEARRERISSLPEVRADLTVGADTTAARLVDLALDHGTIEVDAAVCARLVPGLPVGLHLVFGTDSVVPADVIALAPVGFEASGRAEWAVRFVRLDPRALPVHLAEAISMRRTQRVLPSHDVPVTGTLLTSVGTVAAKVTDLSRGGVGVVVALDPRRLGELHQGLRVRLMFPTLGRMVVLPVTLRSVSPAGPHVRLGLSFVDEPSEDLARLSLWLAKPEELWRAPDPAVPSEGSLQPRSPHGVGSPDEDRLPRHG